MLGRGMAAEAAMTGRGCPTICSEITRGAQSQLNFKFNRTNRIRIGCVTRDKSICDCRCATNRAVHAYNRYPFGMCWVATTE